MTTYTIEPVRETLCGSFSREFAPVLTIQSGDSVHFRTLDAGWHLEPFPGEDVKWRQFEPRVKEQDRGHALCGPIAIQGAQAGMTLEVHINEVRPGRWGWTIGGCEPNEINKRLGLVETCEVLSWTLDPDAMTGEISMGIRLRYTLLWGFWVCLPMSQAFTRRIRRASVAVI